MLQPIAFAILLHPYTVAVTMHASVASEEVDQAEAVAALASWLHVDATDQDAVRSRLTVAARRMHVVNARELAARKLVVVGQVGEVYICRNVRPDEIYTARRPRDTRRGRSVAVTADGSEIVVRSGHVGTSTSRAVRIYREELPIPGERYVLATPWLHVKRDLLQAARGYRSIAASLDELEQHAEAQRRELLAH